VNLDKAYPNQVFTILIWGDDVAKFSPAPSSWDGKRVCATGTIALYRGSPEIVAREAGQITFPR
jgi:DNA/RNA endonuclease YhcR with UshA esterase domain